MQQVSPLIIELKDAQRKLLKLFDAPYTMYNEGTGYSPMFPRLDTDCLFGAYRNPSDIRLECYNHGRF